MKKAAKKRGKGRPKKANRMKAIIIPVSVSPEEEKIWRQLMKKLGVGKSKAVQWLLRWWDANEK
ncbi:MAG: hypothetical protein E6Q97_33775 [Desulfurellales bacterium]|nr:MAG: hypothetical protein E6Q97_33775 [Desulfurellales bacterium]